MGDRLTVLDVVQKSGDFLERKSVERPRLNAEWLAAHAQYRANGALYAIRPTVAASGVGF